MFRREPKQVEERRLKITVASMIHSNSSPNARHFTSDVSDLGIYRVGDRWDITLTLAHDGNGNLLQTPREIVITIRPEDV